jgi:hypothetical protein
MSLQVEDPQYTNNQFKEPTQTNIIKQTQSFTRQHMIKGTMLHVVIMVKGILLILGEMSDFNFLRTC